MAKYIWVVFTVREADLETVQTPKMTSVGGLPRVLWQMGNWAEWLFKHREDKEIVTKLVSNVIRHSATEWGVNWWTDLR